MTSLTYTKFKLSEVLIEYIVGHSREFIDVYALSFS